MNPSTLNRGICVFDRLDGLYPVTCHLQILNNFLSILLSTPSSTTTDFSSATALVGTYLQPWGSWIGYGSSQSETTTFRAGYVTHLFYRNENIIAKKRNPHHVTGQGPQEAGSHVTKFNYCISYYLSGVELPPGKSLKPLWVPGKTHGILASTIIVVSQ